MPFCQTCGAEHADGAAFCPSCGAGTNAPAPSPAITPPQGATAPDRVRSLAGLTTALVVLFALAILVSIAAIGLALWAASDARSIPDARLFEQIDLASDGLGKAGVTVLLWFLVGIPIFVLLVIWTFRAHRNLEAFGAQKPMLPTGMAIGSWFIPLFWFLGPYWCMSDAYKGAAPDAATNPSWRQGPRSAALLAWWIAFCVGNVTWWIGSGIANDSAGVNYEVGTSRLQELDVIDDPERYAAGWTVLAGAHVLGLIAAVLAIVALQQVRDRHEERIAQLSNHTGPLR